MYIDSKLTFLLKKGLNTKTVANNLL